MTIQSYFAFKPVKGSCDLYLDFVLKVICRGDETNYNYLINWMAHCVQKPTEHVTVGLLIKGANASGKTTFAKHFGKLFGKYHVLSGESIVKYKNNWHLRHTVVAVLDDYDFSSSKINDRLEEFLNSESIVIENLGKEPYKISNCVHWIVTTSQVIPNNLQYLKKWVLFEVDNSYAQENLIGKYVKEIINEMQQNDGAGYSALLYHLLNHDISNFNVENIKKII